MYHSKNIYNIQNFEIHPKIFGYLTHRSSVEESDPASETWNRGVWLVLFFPPRIQLFLKIQISNSQYIQENH